jgi:hypothetical protein
LRALLAAEYISADKLGAIFAAREDMRAAVSKLEGVFALPGGSGSSGGGTYSALARAVSAGLAPPPPNGHFPLGPTVAVVVGGEASATAIDPTEAAGLEARLNQLTNAQSSLKSQARLILAVIDVSMCLFVCVCVCVCVRLVPPWRQPGVHWVREFVMLFGWLQSSWSAV